MIEELRKMGWKEALKQIGATILISAGVVWIAFLVIAAATEIPQ